MEIIVTIAGSFFDQLQKPTLAFLIVGMLSVNSKSLTRYISSSSSCCCSRSGWEPVSRSERPIYLR